MKTSAGKSSTRENLFVSIVDDLARNSSLAKRSRRRIILSLIDDIKVAVDHGYSLKSIHQAYVDRKTLSCSYGFFCSVCNSKGVLGNKEKPLSDLSQVSDSPKLKPAVKRPSSQKPFIASKGNSNPQNISNRGVPRGENNGLTQTELRRKLVGGD